MNYIIPSLLGLVLASAPQVPIPIFEPFSSSTMAEPGFNEAVFDAQTLRGFLEESGCAKIRFYNVKASESASNGTAMAIATDASGRELNSGLFRKPYQMSEGFVEGALRISRLSRGNASNACSYMRNSGGDSYSAAFTRDDVLTLLDSEGCDGLRVSPHVPRDGSESMKITAVKIQGGAATDLGSGEQYERICADPCPVVCGPPDHYINIQ